MVSHKEIPRILAPPRQSFFLFGPRGVGKSTWIRRKFPDAHSVNLLDESVYQSLLADISLFSAELHALPQKSWVVVDEVQRIPSLLNEVHRLIEERGFRFVLSGSSARKLKKSGVNLLAGRALRRSLFPFLPEELGAEFDLDSTLAHGTLPVIWTSEAKKDSLQAYVQTYLKEEIQAEALVRNLPGFARFLPIASLFHAQTLNAASLARDAGVARTTVLGYLEVLMDTLLAFQVPAFETRLRVREKHHPKLYWIDPGLVRAVRKIYTAPSPEERGALFEGWIATLLKAYQEYRDLCDEIFYWAPAEAKLTEVDFLLKRENEYLAIEVKSSKKTSPEHTKGLKALSGLKGLQRSIVVYLGDKRLKTPEGIDILPLSQFLSELEAGKLWKD